MFHDILLVQGSTIMPATPEYERNRLARVARNKADGAGPLASIRKLASELVYKQSLNGEDRGSGSEYEPNDEEEADDADDFSGEEEEQEPTLHMSKEKVIHLSVIHIRSCLSL